MKADDLQLDELVDFSEGWLGLHGRRLVLQDIHALAQFRRDLLENVDLTQARAILTRHGYFWGQADAAAMKRIFTWETVEEWIRAGARLYSLQGMAKVMIRELALARENVPFRMDVVWHESGEAAEHLAELGRTDHAVCWTLSGYFSGYCSYCLSEEIYFLEGRCRAKGDRVCDARGMNRAAWGKVLDPYLPYFRYESIPAKVRRLSVEVREQHAELARAREELARLRSLERKGDLVEARSESFRRVLEQAARIAPFDSSVLLTGETGVGKEVLARHLHRLSARHDRPFVAVNCAALPETLLESELFGHQAGAFTGATRDRVGLFEQANGGTILLDEIGDISPAMQMKILRVLQERELMRVGESRVRPIDIRVLAATNRDLADAIGAGRFREDLFYRLRVLEIRIPPLRQRREDILPLARHFIAKSARRLKQGRIRLDAACLDRLTSYPWPGNVRELENAMEHAVVFSRDGVVLPEHLPSHLLFPAPGRPGPSVPPLRLEDVERAHVERLLLACGGNRRQLAKTLGIGATTLWRKLKRWKLFPPSSAGACSPGPKSDVASAGRTSAGVAPS